MANSYQKYCEFSWELGNEPNSLPHQLNFTLPARQLGEVRGCFQVDCDDCDDCDDGDDCDDDNSDDLPSHAA